MICFFDLIHPLGSYHTDVGLVSEEMEDELTSDLVVTTLFLDAVDEKVLGVDPNKFGQSFLMDVVVHGTLDEFMKIEEPLQSSLCAFILFQKQLNQFLTFSLLLNKRKDQSYDIGHHIAVL